VCCGAIATIPLERTIQRRYARGTAAQVWELPGNGHTRLRDRPQGVHAAVVNLLTTSRW
jgi:pimeloyl-ACP methyl ester carboxylesterase